MKNSRVRFLKFPDGELKLQFPALTLIASLVKNRGENQYIVAATKKRDLRITKQASAVTAPDQCNPFIRDVDSLCNMQVLYICTLTPNGSSVEFHMCRM